MGRGGDPKLTGADEEDEDPDDIARDSGDVLEEPVAKQGQKRYIRLFNKKYFSSIVTVFLVVSINIKF